MAQEAVRDALLGTIEAIKQNPSMGNVVFRGDTTWLEDVRCEAKIREFEPIIIDEPPELGGQDAGPNPVELVLVALGTCQEIMYSAYASVMGIDLKSVKVHARGYLDLQGLFGLNETVPPGYKRVVFETEIESDSSTEELKKLVETVESHCPVLDIMTRPQQVSGSVSVNGNKL